MIHGNFFIKKPFFFNSLLLIFYDNFHMRIETFIRFFMLFDHILSFFNRSLSLHDFILCSLRACRSSSFCSFMFFKHTPCESLMCFLLSLLFFFDLLCEIINLNICFSKFFKQTCTVTPLHYFRNSIKPSLGKIN